MQVKKYEASSVLEALKRVKEDLGPDAIILSTKEVKSGVVGQKKFHVVAAVTDTQMKKKELAEQKLGRVYEEKVQSQSARGQKMFIENVFNNIERQHKNKNHQITKTRYIDIDESEEEIQVPQVPVAAKPETKAQPASGTARVKEAAKKAFQSSLTSDFFNNDSALLDDEAIDAMRIKKPAKREVPVHVANMVQRLKACGVSPTTLTELEGKAQTALGASCDRKALVDSWFAKWILHKIQVAAPSNRQLEVFVGPDGSGKTTSLVKLATHYVVNEQKTVAIVTTDLNKVGAVEQLRVYSRILNAPVIVASSIEDAQSKISELSQFDKILLDTPGISLSNMNELDFMRGIAGIHADKTIHLVISALTKANDLGGLLKRFRVAQFNDVVVTNIDQTTQHGILLNIQEKIGMPFHSFGIGSDIVDGFEYASRERVLDLIFKLTKRIGETAHDSSL